ncbi:single-stranded DNA-binding protein [Corynebacterium pyruviciproducens]
MAGETPITVIGNLVADPELRYIPSGAAVANFRIASTPRTYNRQTGQWEDQEALFLTCNIWREAAENVANSLTKGMRVIVNGRLRQRSYQTREGENRTIFEVEVDEVGPSLRYATAQVTRNERGGANGGSGNFGGGRGGNYGSGNGGSATGGSNYGATNGYGSGNGGSAGAGGFGGGQMQQSQQQQRPQQQSDPWNSSSPADGFGGEAAGDPPF